MASSSFRRKWIVGGGGVTDLQSYTAKPKGGVLMDALGAAAYVRSLAKDADLLEITGTDPECVLKLTKASRTAPLFGSKRVLFLDQADALTKSEQKVVASLIYETRHAFFLAADELGEVSPDLRKACLAASVPPAFCHHFLSEGTEALPSVQAPDEALKLLLGGQRADFPASEYWRAGSWVIDNTQGQEAVAWDVFSSRVRKAGKSMEKYALLSVRGVSSRPKFPWSVRVR